MYFGGMLVCISLPFAFKWFGQFNKRFITFYYPLVGLFFLSGILAILIIGQLRKMFATVLADDCFVMENVVSLRKMGTYSFLIAAVTFLRMFLYITPSVFIIILVFIIAGLFSKVLAGVFDKAVNYKLENDLTI
jgi:hypothetical protein